MKELTKKQKLDFILYCMEKIDEWAVLKKAREMQFYTCNHLFDIHVANSATYTNKGILSHELFPELFKFSNSQDEVQFWDYDTDATEDNQIRAIIYSFLYNELTGEIKI